MTTALVAAGVMTLGVSGAMAAEKYNVARSYAKTDLKISGSMKALVMQINQVLSRISIRQLSEINGTDSTRGMTLKFTSRVALS